MCKQDFRIHIYTYNIIGSSDGTDLPAYISGYEMEWVDVGEVIAAVNLNGLQQPHHHPQPDQGKVVTQ